MTCSKYSYATEIILTAGLPWKTASPTKVSATKGYGANVILEGSTYDESWAYAQKISSETNATIIHAPENYGLKQYIII